MAYTSFREIGHHRHRGQERGRAGCPWAPEGGASASEGTSRKGPVPSGKRSQAQQQAELATQREAEGATAVRGSVLGRLQALKVEQSHGNTSFGTGRRRAPGVDGGSPCTSERGSRHGADRPLMRPRGVQERQPDRLVVEDRTEGEQDPGGAGGQVGREP